MHPGPLGVVRTGAMQASVSGPLTDLEVLGYLGTSYNEAIQDGIRFGLEVPMPEGLLTEDSVRNMWINIVAYITQVSRCEQAIEFGLEFGLTLEMPDPVTVAAADELWRIVREAEELANQGG